MELGSAVAIERHAMRNLGAFWLLSARCTTRNVACVMEVGLFMVRAFGRVGHTIPRATPTLARGASLSSKICILLGMLLMEAEYALNVHGRAKQSTDDTLC